MPSGLPDFTKYGLLAGFIVLVFLFLSFLVFALGKALEVLKTFNTKLDKKDIAFQNYVDRVTLELRETHTRCEEKIEQIGQHFLTEIQLVRATVPEFTHILQGIEKKIDLISKR